MSEFVNRVFNHSCEAMPEIPDGSVHCCVTSPPYYGLRDYGVNGQIGLEESLTQYIDRLVAVFREVRRVLRDDGTAWLNLGDSYAGSWGAQSRPDSVDGLSANQITAHPKRKNTGTIRDPGLKPKDMMLVPHAVAMALRADGWWLRDAIVWHKPNPMPSSVDDRCTPCYEMVFMLAKSSRYYANMDAVKTPLSESSVQRLNQPTFDQQTGGEKDYANGTNPNRSIRKTLENLKRKQDALGKATYTGFNDRWDENPTGGANLRNVWQVPTEPYAGAHFAVMPRELVRRCVLIGSPADGIVLDPFMGSGTTAQVASDFGRRFTGYEISPEYCALIRDRLGLFGDVIREESAS